MKNVFKGFAIAAAVLCSSQLFASTSTTPKLANDGKTGLTGLFEVTGDGAVGLANGSNTLYNESTFEFRTSNEVFAAMINARTAAGTQASHAAGKGVVFFANSDAQSGMCQEYIAADNDQASDSMTVASDFTSATFGITLAVAADGVTVTGCSPV